MGCGSTGLDATNTVQIHICHPVVLVLLVHLGTILWYVLLPVLLSGFLHCAIYRSRCPSFCLLDLDKPLWSNGYVYGLSRSRPGFDPPTLLYMLI